MRCIRHHERWAVAAHRHSSCRAATNARTSKPMCTPCWPKMPARGYEILVAVMVCPIVFWPHYPACGSNFGAVMSGRGATFTVRVATSPTRSSRRTLRNIRMIVTTYFGLRGRRPLRGDLIRGPLVRGASPSTVARLSGRGRGLPSPTFVVTRSHCV
jgi:hypothetical protein